MRDKFLSLPKILANVRAARELGKRIVTTNGCFDILHLGHLNYLTKARALGDLLIVGVNSDRSVRANKEPGRPLHREKIRARMLAGLSAVDYVFVFGEKDPRGFLSKIRPDIHVKGGDYHGRILEQGVVEKYGGRVKLLGLVPGVSTTALIRKIVRVYGKRDKNMKEQA
jgi:D-glycero-beta-D-manno-heptose 1-phosphate adenylyltransferase